VGVGVGVGVGLDEDSKTTAVVPGIVPVKVPFDTVKTAPDGPWSV
jgi:hypothetical protein